MKWLVIIFPFFVTIAFSSEVKPFVTQFQNKEHNFLLKIDDDKVQAELKSGDIAPPSLILKIIKQKERPITIALRLVEKKPASPPIYEGKIQPMSGSYAAAVMELRFFIGNKSRIIQTKIHK